MVLFIILLVFTALFASNHLRLTHYDAGRRNPNDMMVLLRKSRSLTLTLYPISEVSFICALVIDLRHVNSASEIKLYVSDFS